MKLAMTTLSAPSAPRPPWLSPLPAPSSATNDDATHCPEGQSYSLRAEGALTGLKRPVMGRSIEE